MKRNFVDNSPDFIQCLPSSNTTISNKSLRTVEVQTEEDSRSKRTDVSIDTYDGRVDIGISAQGVKYAPPKINEIEVMKFLSKVMPLMLNELIPTSAYQFLEKKTSKIKIENVLKFETNNQYTITSMDVNCTGRTIAVSLEYNDHYGFCRHNSSVFFLSTGNSSSHSIQTDSCTTCVKYHPHYPGIIAVGFHTGEIIIYRSEEKWAQTKLGVNHVDKIVALDWIIESQVAKALVSVSIGGIITVWNLKGRNTQTKVLEQSNPMKISEKNGSITCLVVIPNTFDALVAMQSGTIYKVPLPYENSTSIGEKMIYNGHTGPISSISICPIAPGLFVTAGTDEILSVHNQINSEPLAVTEFSNGSLLDASFSPHSPSICAIINRNRVLLYDITNSSPSPFLVYDIPKAQKVTWNPSIPGMIIVGCSNGNVQVLQCSEGVLEQRAGSNRVLVEYESRSMKKKSK